MVLRVPFIYPVFSAFFKDISKSRSSFPMVFLMEMGVGIPGTVVHALENRNSNRPRFQLNLNSIQLKWISRDWWKT